jgi:hypothetical protein
MRRTRSVALLFGISALFAALASSCRDVLTEMPSGPKVPQSGLLAGSARRTYSSIELHHMNPFDWVGRIHNGMVDELRKAAWEPGASPRMVCERALERLAAEDLGSGTPAISSHERDMTRAAVLSMPTCGARKAASPSTEPVLFPATFVFDDTTWVYPSATAAAMMDSIDVEVEQASDSNDLASRLSPYYNTALGMGFPDSAAIQIVISIAQSSWGYWRPSSTFGTTLSNEISQLDECTQGNAENTQYEVDDITYICQNSEWLMAGYRSPRRAAPTWRLVATRAPDCMDAFDAAIFVLSGDVVGAGASTWGKVLGFVPGGQWVAAAVIGATAGVYSYAAFRAVSWMNYNQC